MSTTTAAPAPGRRRRPSRQRQYKIVLTAKPRESVDIDGLVAGFRQFAIDHWDEIEQIHKRQNKS